MVTKFSGRVGASRVSTQTDSTHANFQQSVKSSMAGILEEYKRWIAHMNAEIADVLYDALVPTFELSQELVPVDTGALKESGYLEKDKNAVAIGYAKGGNPDYATIVHEDPDKPHKAPTQYKFLQLPLEQDFENVKARVIQGLKDISGV